MPWLSLAMVSESMEKNYENTLKERRFRKGNRIVATASMKTCKCELLYK